MLTMRRIADVVAIAALSVPTVIPARSKIAFLDADDGKQRSAKLSALIGITDGNHPTRSSILANVVCLMSFTRAYRARCRKGCWSTLALM